MIIRRYKNADCDMVAKLFYETVHSVNAKDYTEEQLSVWANNADSLKSRRNDLLKQYTLSRSYDSGGTAASGFLGHEAVRYAFGVI